MKGRTLNETYDYIPYRTLMCRMVQQAILNAQGRELTSLAPRGKAYVRAKEKAAAIEYLLSDDFECDCILLGMTSQDCWQIPMLVTA